MPTVDRPLAQTCPHRVSREAECRLLESKVSWLRQAGGRSDVLSRSGTGTYRQSGLLQLDQISDSTTDNTSDNTSHSHPCSHDPSYGSTRMPRWLFDDQDRSLDGVIDPMTALWNCIGTASRYRKRRRILLVDQLQSGCWCDDLGLLVVATGEGRGRGIRDYVSQVSCPRDLA